jgi:hypothetical protein
LNGQAQMAFSGELELTFPTTVFNGAAVDYTPTYIKCIVSPHGTESIPLDATAVWKSVEVTPLTNGYRIVVKGTDALPVQVAVLGSQIIP